MFTAIDGFWNIPGKYENVVFIIKNPGNRNEWFQKNKKNISKIIKSIKGKNNIFFIILNIFPKIKQFYEILDFLKKNFSENFIF